MSKKELRVKHRVTGGTTRQYPGTTLDHQTVRAANIALKAGGSKAADSQTKVFLASADVNSLFAISTALEAVGFDGLDEILRTYRTNSGFQSPPTGHHELLQAARNRALLAEQSGLQEERRRGHQISPSILVAFESGWLEHDNARALATVVTVRFPNNHETNIHFEGAPLSVNDLAFQDQLADAVEHLLRLAPEFLPKPLKPAVPRVPRGPSS